MFCAEIFGRDDKTFTFSGTTVNNFKDVDKVLFVLKWPSHFVVVSSSEINHNMSVPEEKHYCAGIIQLIHGVEVRHFVNVDHIKYSKLLNCFSTFYEDFVNLHAGFLCVSAKSNAYYFVFFR